MGSGIFDLPPQAVLVDKLARTEERLAHAQTRYATLRNLVSFYEILGARDAGAQVSHYRTALQKVIAHYEDLDPMCSDMHDTGRMADIAREALKG